jgi:hypothetical protein
LLQTFPVLRRLLALTGFVVLVVLALALFYRVYLHHTNATPYIDDDRAIVRLGVKITARSL